MFKRRTILTGLAALGLTLALNTQVHGVSTTGPDAWVNVYNEAVAGATTTITAPSTITIPLLGTLLSTLTSILQIFFNLAGFWGG